MCVDIILEREALHDTVVEIGLIGKAQFVDLNEGVTAFARSCTGHIRQCEDLQRQLRYIEERLVKEKGMASLYEKDTDMCAPVEELRTSISQGQMNSIEERIESTVAELAALQSSMEGLHSEINYFVEKSLLAERLSIMAEGEIYSAFSGNTGRKTSGMTSVSRLSTLLGVIPAQQSDTLYRLCYRISRGNAVIDVNVEAEALLNPKTGERDQVKASFIVLSSSKRMIERLTKLVSGLGATIYTLEEINSVGNGAPSSTTVGPHGSSLLTSRETVSGAICPTIPPHLQSALSGIERRLIELLSGWYREHRLYKTYLKVEKAVYSNMNLCNFSGATCTATLWIACKYEPALLRAMEDAVISSGSDVQSVMTRHPSQRNKLTYFETNKYTECFQSIVDSYGMARYKEVNPGVFTIVTFPYLFGIMYGDIGHGGILLMVSLYFIVKERSWQTEKLPEILAMIFGGRYLLLLMSLFAIYMGFLYNDFFGFSLNIFPSGYTWAPIEEQSGTTYPTQPNGRPNVRPNHVYAVGLDVAWAETENKLEFYNSVKMKCAVVVGVVQMFAGLFLALNNFIYQRNWWKVCLLFVPEFVFLLCTFGYMAFLIVVKWLTRWEDTNDAPSILEVMTNFFLAPGSVTQPLFTGQGSLQVVLLLVAVFMVPIMLLGIPMVELRDFKRWKRRQRYTVNLDGNTTLRNSSDDARLLQGPTSVASIDHFSNRSVTSDGAGHAYHEELHSEEGSLADVGVFIPRPPLTEEEEIEHDYFTTFEFGELMIHYMIHTIEYVLSSVSNTASYLRLWALSLAHAQLSEVFFTFAVVSLLRLDTTGIFIALGVFAWLGVTLGVLVGMEALSAFLHALRLHWVEFQNKFYVGDGVALEPLDLVNLNAI